MSPLCPHCSQPIPPNGTINRAGWQLHPLYALYNGASVPLTSQQRKVLYILANAHPRSLNSETLLARVSSSLKPKLLHVVVSSIRRQLQSLDVPDPVQTLATGYAWSDQQ